MFTNSLFLKTCTAIAASAILLNGAITPAVQRALDSISAANLKGDLSFLASDALQGRYTPSPGLDVAAEFIASQFREAGLEPGGDHEYFQNAAMIDRHPGEAQSDLTVQDGAKTFKVALDSITVVDANEKADINGAPVVVLKARDPDLLKGVDLNGKAVVVPRPDFSKAADADTVYRKMRAFDLAVASSNAAIEIVVVDRKSPVMNRLIEAEAALARRTPAVSVVSSELQNWIKHPANTSDPRSVSIQIGAPDDQKATVKNVIGILRGSDPKLKDTCVLVTAHYDHIGTTSTASGFAMDRPKGNSTDHIYNGANDDGSGTVSVIEIAKALTHVTPRPKRSIVFMTFFGEERGELGSKYYGTHPVFPIAKTIADVNLEQLGRTDSTKGRELRNASLTGYDYSTVTKFLEDAGRETGIKLYLDKEASDAYFTRSDNDALAQQGVPAHTLTVAFDYADYHGLSDEWQKIDYDNMARVDRMVGLALVHIANSVQAPQWNSQNPKTAPFREAQRKGRELKAAR